MVDDFGEVGGLADLPDLFVAERQAQGDIIGEGVFKYFGVLREEGDVFVEAFEPAGSGRGNYPRCSARGRRTWE